MPLTTAHLTALRTEIAIDPAGRGYAGKTAAEVWDLLCAEPVTVAAPTTRTQGITRVQAMQGVPGLLAVEVAWRVAAKTDATLAAYLTYWDDPRIASVDFAQPLAGAIAAALEPVGLTAEMRAALVSLCTVAVPGAETRAASRRIAVLGAPLGSVEDIAALLQEIG